MEVAAAAAPAPDPQPAAPRELCAGSSFLARAVCLQRECRKPGMQQHPQCVQMRELQRSLHNPDGGG
ncbi:MAG: hypothetical protein LC125_12440 [Burkholderiales bacterium]|nr:hypothetical protein [Burkholderiales bacterium]